MFYETFASIFSIYILMGTRIYYIFHINFNTQFKVIFKALSLGINIKLKFLLLFHAK